jgi:hypothetical protein
MIKPAKAAPKNGDTIVIFPVNTTARILTPMEKPRTHPLFCIAWDGVFADVLTSFFFMWDRIVNLKSISRK